MRILLVSFYFAPHNTMAAHRLSKLAEYLLQNGHDVRVVSAYHESLPKDISSSVPEDLTIRTRSLDIDILSRVTSRLRYLIGSARGAGSTSPSHGTSVNPTVHAGRKRFSARFQIGVDRLYRSLLFWPDASVGWFFYALPATFHLCRRWRPDIIYATSPPETALILGSIASWRLSIPWVAEIRDRWADDPYGPRPRWRAFLDRRLERRVLSSARAIVTVSETWAQAYRERYSKTTAVIYNGFMPEDYEHQPSMAPPSVRDSLRIVYTGAVYVGRDPTPLWQALRLIGPAAEGIRIEFYGSPGAAILAGAARHGVSENVQVREYLPHHEVVRRQCQADVLLLLQWNDPSEAGNIPGKLFEYLGARRPILALGYPGGEMAAIVRERAAGFVSNEPTAIARQLEAWRDEKRDTGRIAPPPETARAGFSREAQFERLVGFLLERLDGCEDSNIPASYC